MTSRDSNATPPVEQNQVTEDLSQNSRNISSGRLTNQQVRSFPDLSEAEYESIRVSEKELHLPLSGAVTPRDGHHRSFNSRWSDGRRSPALLDNNSNNNSKGHLSPISLNHRSDKNVINLATTFQHNSFLQPGSQRLTPNYHTSNEYLEEKEISSDEELDVHSLGEKLTDVLETSLRSSVGGASQRGETHNTFPRAAFHIFKGNVGAGVFLLPTYYQDAGYGLGLIVVILLGILMIDCALALLNAKQKIDLPEVKTYPAVVGHVLGHTLMDFTRFSLIFTQFGFCVVYIQYASSMFAGLFNLPHMYELFVFLSVVIVTPMTFLSHRMGILAYASMIAAIFVALVLAGAVAEEVNTLSIGGISEGAYFFIPTMRILVFLSGHMFSLEGIGIVLPVENSMSPEDRPKFGRLVKYTLASVVTLYVVFGLLGYLAFGETLRTSVVLALKPSITKSILQVLLGLSLIFGYPIQYVPAIQLVDRALGISVRKTRTKAYIVRIALNIFFALLAASIGGDTINIFASFLGAFTGVHLMITMPTLLALLTDRVENAVDDELYISDYFSMLFTMPNNIAEFRWYVYLFLAMFVWIGGTYYTFQSVFG